MEKQLSHVHDNGWGACRWLTLRAHLVRDVQLLTWLQAARLPCKHTSARHVVAASLLCIAAQPSFTLRHVPMASLPHLSTARRRRSARRHRAGRRPPPCSRQQPIVEACPAYRAAHRYQMRPAPWTTTLEHCWHKLQHIAAPLAVRPGSGQLNAIFLKRVCNRVPQRV